MKAKWFLVLLASLLLGGLACHQEKSTAALDQMSNTPNPKITGDRVQFAKPDQPGSTSSENVGVNVQPTSVFIQPISNFSVSLARSTINKKDGFYERLFVANKIVSGITIFDQISLKVVATLPPAIASAMSFVFDHEYIYLVDSMDISIIDREKLSEVSEIEYDGNLDPVFLRAVLAPDSKTMYVASIA